MSDTEFLAVRAEHWARAMTAIPSITGSIGEAEFPAELVELLGQSEAFGGAGSTIWTVAVPGCPHRRACVLALVRGSSPQTVVLTGHFDVVDTANYGALEPLAFDPDRLGKALAAQIATEPFEPRAAQAQADLASGAFLAGRGLLDMKGGLAAGLAVIELLARQSPRLSLLFIAVPDEEGNSAGARHMSQVLPKIAAEHALDIIAAINLDAYADDGDGAKGRVISLGSIGKLLPSALVIGRAAHASETFRGFGAAALAGAFAAEVEWSPELTERSGDELGAGPTLLGMKDSKTFYDVTMPASVWMYWNVATHRRSPEAVISALETAAARSSTRLMERLAERAEAVGAEIDLKPVPIVRFDALLREVTSDGAKAATIAAFVEEAETLALSLPEQCRLITERVWSLSGRSGPAIVIGFASIPYLPVELRDDERARNLREAVHTAARATRLEFGQSIRSIRYFPGISDVSFFGQADDTHVDAIAANTPVWRSILGGAEKFGAAGIPTINVGPWGRDYHTRLERMHVDFAFRVLPSLILRIVGNLSG